MTSGSTIAMNMLCFMIYHLFHSFITYTEVGVWAAHTHSRRWSVWDRFFAAGS